MKTFMHFVNGIVAVADAFAGTVVSTLVSLKNNKTAVFVIHKGAGATGTSTITVEAADDNVPTTTQAIPFKYQEILTDDTHSVLKSATATGFATTAGANQKYIIYANSSDVGVDDYNYCRVKAVEVVDSPVLGGIIAILTEPAVDKEVQNTVL